MTVRVPALYTPPPPPSRDGVLPERVLSVRVRVPELKTPPPRRGRIAGEGAVGEGEGAAVVPHAAAAEVALLPERVLAVMVTVPCSSPRRRRRTAAIAGEGAVGDGDGAPKLRHATAVAGAYCRRGCCQ